MTPEQDERLNRWSASSADRVWHCQGSEQLIRSIPAEQLDTTPAEIAESGSRIHATLETGEAGELEMTEVEIAEQLKVLENEAVLKWILDFDMANCIPEVQREQRFWVRDAKLEPITSAKCDVVYVFDGRALALDYKSGFLPATPAQRNLQAKVQAVALWAETGVTNIRVGIVQHRLRSVVTLADYTYDDLMRAYEDILLMDWRTKQPGAPRVPGAHCGYCPAKAHCMEFASYAHMPSVLSNTWIASQKQITTPEGVAVKPTEYVQLAVDRLSNDDLAYIERRRGMAEKMFAAVKSRMKKLPTEELAAIGFELVEGRAMSKVTDFPGLTEFISRLNDKDLLTAEEFSNCFTFSIGALESTYLPRVLAAAESAGVKLTAKAAKETLRAELSKFIAWEAGRSEKMLKQKE